MRKLKLTKDTIDNILESLLKRSPSQYTEYEQTVFDIVNTVREKGDEAVFAYTKKFDGADINKDNIVHSVTYDEECPKKLATPDDVTVGVIPDDILKVYGTPDEVLPPVKGQSGYLYKSESAPSEEKNMRFTIYEGRIVGIYITYTSTQKWDRLK